MKVKKIMISFLIISIMLISSINVFSAETSVLKLTLLRYDPTPAKPGDYITAYVQVENVGTAQAKNVKVTFKENYPFSVDDSSKKDVVIGKLETGQIYIADFKIRVDINAVDGANELKFTASDDYTSTSSPLTEKVFQINVEARDAQIELETVDVTPSQINPGDVGKISLTLKNNADTTLSDVKTKIVTYATSGVTTIDLPFAIQDSVNEKSLNSIKPGEEKIVEYNLLTYPSITPGIYKLPLMLTFYDGSGQNHTKTEFITLMVNPKIDVYMTIDSSKVTKEAKTGIVTIKIINKGLGDVKLGNLKIEKSLDFDLLSPSDQNYIGNIDSDDYKTADFEIIAKKDALSIPLTLTFKDALNKEHEIKTTLDLKVLSQKTLTPKSTNYTWLIIAAIIIIGAVVYFVRRKKRK